jgi:hypothetical protein
MVTILDQSYLFSISSAFFPLHQNENGAASANFPITFRAIGLIISSASAHQRVDFTA